MPKRPVCQHRQEKTPKQGKPCSQNPVHQRLEKKMNKRQPNSTANQYKTASRLTDKSFSNYYQPLADKDKEDDEILKKTTTTVIVEERFPTVTTKKEPNRLGCYINPVQMKEFLEWQKHKRQYEEWEKLKKDHAYASYDQVKDDCAFTKANIKFNRSIWLGDTAASAHMGNTDEGMTDVEEVHEEIMIGNGKKLLVTKIGTLHRTAFQEDGTTLDIQLKGYKYAPQLHVNLFSITKALDQGWMISNKGVIIILSKGRAKLQFDKIFTTNTGKVIGVELLARQPNTNKNDTAFTGTDSSDSNAPQDSDKDKDPEDKQPPSDPSDFIQTFKI